MTADEKRDQKRALLLEFHDAEDDLAHLAEKAKAMVSNLSAIIEVLNKASGMQDSMPEKTRYLRIEVQNEPKYRAAMDFDDMTTLVQQLDEAKNKIKILRERKAALGLH